MASYFNLTLDTTAPSGLKVSINDDALYTTSTSVTVKITLSDEQTSGYQMKIWGIAGVSSESAASWETFAAQKTVTLESGDGLKTVHVKVRDDVGNESAEASDDITLNTAVPAVTVTGPDKSKISKVSGFDKSKISFTVDVEFAEYKVCVVPETSSTQDAGTQIPTSGGSVNTSSTQDAGTQIPTSGGSVNTSGTGGSYPASTPIEVTISGADLQTASSGDGVKVVKVFVRTAAGIWSVA